MDLQFLGKEAGEEGFREKLVKEYINSEYYKKVREILPNLEVLDQFDREGNEFESDEDEKETVDLYKGALLCVLIHYLTSVRIHLETYCV